MSTPKEVIARAIKADMGRRGLRMGATPNYPRGNPT